MEIGRFKVGGVLAWLLWGGVHIAFLVGFRNRVMVLLSWFWSWLLNARDARLITGDARLDIRIPRPAESVPDDVRGVGGEAPRSARTGSGRPRPD